MKTERIVGYVLVFYVAIFLGSFMVGALEGLSEGIGVIMVAVGGMGVGIIHTKYANQKPNSQGKKTKQNT